MALDEILHKYFGSKNAFLAKRKTIGYVAGGEPEPMYRYVSVSGGKAYGNLTGLLYDLENLLGKEFDANRWITELDDIVSGEDY